MTFRPTAGSSATGCADAQVHRRPRAALLFSEVILPIMLGALQKRLRIAVTIRGHGRNDMARVMRVRVGARPAVHRDEVQHALSSNDAVNLSLTPASRMASGNGLPADIWSGREFCCARIVHRLQIVDPMQPLPAHPPPIPDSTLLHRRPLLGYIWVRGP